MPDLDSAVRLIISRLNHDLRSSELVGRALADIAYSPPTPGDPYIDIRYHSFKSCDDPRTAEPVNDHWWDSVEGPPVPEDTPVVRSESRLTNEVLDYYYTRLTSEGARPLRGFYSTPPPDPEYVGDVAYATLPQPPP